MQLRSLTDLYLVKNNAYADVWTIAKDNQALLTERANILHFPNLGGNPHMTNFFRYFRDVGGEFLAESLSS